MLWGFLDGQMGVLMTDYASAYDYKSFVRIPDEDTTDDAEITLALAAAKAAIDMATNRSFDTTADTASERTYPVYYNKSISRYQADIDDVATTTSFAVEVNDSALTTDDYTLGPRNATAKGMPYTVLTFSPGVVSASTIIAVTAKWGWAAVPDAIKNATLLQANRLMKRRDAPFGVAGSPELGSELRLLAKVDPDVDVLIRKYVRWWAAA